MRVKIKMPLAGPMGVFGVGEIAEVSSEVGRRWVEDGAASVVRGQVVERAVEPDEAEQAIVEPVPVKKKRAAKKRASKG